MAPPAHENPQPAPAAAASKPQPAPWWREHVNLTNLLTVVFLAFMCKSLLNLYSIAVPQIPPITRPDGSLKPAMRPLWEEARAGIELELVLSAAANRGNAQSARSELLVFRGGDLNFTWDRMHAEVELDLQLLRATAKKGAGDGIETPTDDDAAASAADSGYSVTGGGKVVGLRAVCRRGEDASADAAALCLSLARQWAAQHPAADSYLLWEPAKKAASGLIAWLSRSLTGGDGNNNSSSSSVAAKPVLSIETPLVIGEWTTPVAKKIGRSLTRGQPVFAHSAITWKGLPALPPQLVKHLSAGPPVPVPQHRPANVPLPGGASVGDSGRNDEASAPATSVVEWGRFEDLKVASTTARLVADANYDPPKRLRHLWADPFGTNTPAVLDAEGRVINPDAGVKADKGGEKRQQGDGSDSNSTEAAAVNRPVKGKAWPHWMGQLSLYAVTSFDQLPRDELPPQIHYGVRTDPTRTVHVPILAANPVRPTRDRLHALNRTVTSLPLRITLAPAAVGKWQLLTVLDNSLNTQQALGATEKDTDDVIRLMAETPLWLLGVTFVVSFVHILFDVLAFKNDVAWWQSTSSLSGISVKSLLHQLISNSIITLYLWREGSSLLVLVPQAANTLLYVWKMAKASGVTFSFRYYLIPVIGYNARLHASAVKGKGSSADEEAVHYMTLLLTPFLAGFALYSFVHHKYTGWGEFALTTAVSAVYGAGFALMCPQLYINWKLKSVAHMPWKVLVYRFFSTVVDDLFASIIKMPLMHRVSVFRDDVIFVLYMLQRRWYPVDRSRPAEGYEGEDTSDYDFSADGKPAAVASSTSVSASGASSSTASGGVGVASAHSSSTSASGLRHRGGAAGEGGSSLARQKR